MQVEKMNDEAVQLKLLQTALTLMQSSLLSQTEVCAVMQHRLPPQQMPLMTISVMLLTHCDVGRHSDGAWYMLQASCEREEQKL